MITAFPSAVWSDLNSAMQTLAQRMQQSNVPPRVTPKQLIAFCAPPEDRATLFRIAQIADIGRYWRQSAVGLKIDGMEISFTLTQTDRDAGPLLPKHPALQPDADAELIEQIRAWGSRRIQIGWQFGQLNKVVHVLDKLCSRPEQVKYLWPSIMSLCRVADLSDLVAKLEEAPVPNKVPSIHFELRAGLRAAAGTVAVACLLETQPEPTHEVTLSVSTDEMSRDDGYGKYNCL